MEDKDLDKYFKDRSGLFNEAPGEGLWAKIEANIEPPAQGGLKAGKWLLPIAGVVVVAGLVAAWLATRNTAETPAPAPQHPQEVTVIIDSFVPITNKPAITIEDTIAPVFEAVEIKTAKKQPVINTSAPAITTDAAQIDELDNNQAKGAKPNTTESQTTPLQTYSVKSDTDTIAKQGKKSIPYYFDFDENKDAIEITITQKISPAERNSLIQNTIKGNAPYMGRKIIIKANGYRIYSHIITQADYKRYEAGKDTVKTTPRLKLEVSADTIYHNLNQDSLTPATIRFENKSVRKE